MLGVIGKWSCQIARSTDRPALGGGGRVSRAVRSSQIANSTDLSMPYNADVCGSLKLVLNIGGWEASVGLGGPRGDLDGVSRESRDETLARQAAREQQVDESVQVFRI